MTSPTNWIIGDNDMVRRGDRVHLADGREGTIVRVSRWRGWPVVQVAGELTEVEVHPQRIASRLPAG